MSAIERCRTAALGGHVERCEKCSHTVIAYNSCRNRHCPKCQGAAAQEWLAEREAELLPVPYFPRGIHACRLPIADIAYQNKAVIYDLLFKASSETMLTIAADPKHLGARIGILVRPAHLGLGNDPPPARPHDRAGRRILARRQPLGRVPTELLPPGTRAVALVPPVVPGEARRRSCRRRAAVLRQACRARPCTSVRRLSSATAQQRMGGLLQTPLRRARGSAALSRPLHPPRRHLEPPPDRMRSRKASPSSGRTTGSKVPSATR